MDKTEFISKHKWWMFLPLILCICGIVYHAKKESGKPDPKYISKETGLEQEIFRSMPETKEKQETENPAPGENVNYSVMKIFELYGFMQDDHLLELLALRLPPESERREMLKHYFPENDTLLNETAPFTDQQLKERQNLWIKSGSINDSTQRRMLKDDKIMQYAALELIIRLKIKELQQNPSIENRHQLWHIVRLQSQLSE